MPDYSWINFRINLEKLPWTTWVRLGECVAKCEQIKNVPLKPYLKDQLHLIYLAKGLHATTAIEGNTLTEDQVRDLIQKKLTLPASKEYLRKEVNNVLEVCNDIAIEISKRTFGRITVEKICHYNKKILQNNVPHDEASVPGKIRNHNVVVGNVYRAPDAKDVAALTEKFCTWMNSPVFVNEQFPFHFAIIKAIAAHLYIAWIHPFGDGNGRVARLLEFAILLSSGVPSPASHLLSNHYNMTRAEYYHRLDRASKTGDPTDFFSYAIQGLLDGLEEQLRYIQRHIMSVCWRDYIYEEFGKHRSSSTVKRRRDLAVRISDQPTALDKNGIFILMREGYKNKTERTLSRDLNELVKMRLIVREKNNYAANKNLILQFLPFTVALSTSAET